ncbi:MAG: 50S ribosomal protein L25/general stress protein Ctc [Candidatus Dojkabacteria bacterium]
MTKIILEKRDQLGKKAKQLYSEGKVPAVIYDNKGNSTTVKANEGEIARLLTSATTTTIVDLEIDGKDVKAVIKEVDVNPLDNQLRHIAFFQIDENAEMVFTVPFKLIGISPAVKNNLGVLVQTVQNVEVKCTLAKLVPEIEVDVTGLDNTGMSILVSDIKLPEGMHLLRESDAGLAVAAVTQLQKLTEVETTPAADATEETTEEASEEAAAE